ncbi:unnamed protein product [Brassicogethes aeneus]|uniref:Uncharacterized protein n=1 Tax=Brassicogethes aeneus TaxID=1431903 RepID=A0A9P0BGS4_BRAAE|nr:unnamed protein product [Brassicogethes aeneus]
MSANSELQSRIKFLDINDDGIRFNQKIRFILEKWTANCPTKEDVQKSVKSLYKNSLKDAVLSAKVLLLLTSKKFVTLEVAGENVRSLFVRYMHKNFDSTKKSGFVKDDGSRMSVRILGFFYNKARTASGEVLVFLSGPLITLLSLLLKSKEVKNVKLFASQMFLNGVSLKENQREKFKQIILDVRTNLLTTEDDCVKNWLMFSLEVSNIGYSVLPSDMEVYYQSIMNDEEFGNVYKVTLENHQQKTVFKALNGKSPVEKKETKKVLTQVDVNIFHKDMKRRNIPTALTRRLEAIRRNK